MADEEHKEEHHEEHHEEHGKKEEHGKHPEKNKKLLWWGLGLAGAGLLVSLLLFNKGNSQAANDQTVANPSMPFVPNPTNPYDASANEYWPVLQSNPSTGAITGTSGSTSSSSGTSKKKKGSGSKSKSGSSSHSKTPKSGSKTKVTPHHTVAAKPHAGGAHGYVYTVQKGDTLQSLQNKAWPGSVYSTNRSGRPTSGTNIQTYANNAKILKASGGKLKPGMKINL